MSSDQKIVQEEQKNLNKIQKCPGLPPTILLMKTFLFVQNG